MNDKSIRAILTEYLKAVKSDIRIYEEKYIGSSICDVMAVTSELIGYEIKSDLDNYARLPEQIKAYDNFFDKNYIVVSSKHSSMVQSKVPVHWGIIYIEERNITVLRKAMKNKNVSRRKQLSVLWKLELKNLLIKNNLPLYPQKDKGFIADRIFESVNSDLLGKQIAQELMNRDYSVYDEKKTFDSTEENMPTSEIVDVLSETEMNLDEWIAIYNKAKARRESKEKKLLIKQEAPRAEHKIPYTDIAVTLGAPWISPRIINDFIFYHIKRISPTLNVPNIVSYEPVTGGWSITSKGVYGSCYYTTSEYGLVNFNALSIIESTLNLREIKLYDGTEYNEANTIAALGKQEKIISEFEEWVWQDEDRRWEIEEAYNSIFGNYRKEKYNGSALEFPNMSKDYSLYDYQKDAVDKIIKSKNTLLAFDVGAGKTYIMIAAAMNMRQMGLSHKNMFVVPNHIVGQWEKIFTQLYPNAKVLAIEPKSFKPEMRSKVMEQIRDGDYDGIIIAYSCFEMIPLSADTVLNNMRKKLGEIDNAIQDIHEKNRSSGVYNWGETPLNRERDYIKKLTQELLDNMHPVGKGDIYFEDLEINTLFLDEAHNYKNLPIRTKLKNLRGINVKGSLKCTDMLHKVRAVQNANGGRGVVFATGTPICNSISDCYTMQIYLQNEEMERTRLAVFDNWVKTFAKPQQIMEVDVDTSKYRVVTRFARFHNLPELSSMFSQIGVFYAVDEKNLPDFNGYTDVVVKKYDELSEYMSLLCSRTEKIRAKEVNPKKDNMLKVSTDGRKAALDLRLVDCQQPHGDKSKVDMCVSRVKELYDKYATETQLIFCDYSTPKGDKFNVYQDIKEKLVSQGIPEKEIAFIHSYSNESRKLELYRKFNNGEVRILIGSTFKLGIGANVQTRLKAVHHLDVPWRPADMVQREGRILRRGNENENVFIYRYIAEGSFDSYSWQVLETKQNFISQFLSGSTYQRTASDLENNVLTYAEVKALALSQPLMKQLAETENDIKNLRILVAKEKENQIRLHAEMDKLNLDMPKANTRHYYTQRNLSIIENLPNVDTPERRKSLTDALTYEAILKKAPFESVVIYPFLITLPEIQNKEKPYVLLIANNEKYALEMGESAKGNAQRVINFFKSFDKVAKSVEEHRNNLLSRYDECKKLLSEYNNPYAAELAEKEAFAQELRLMIKAK